MVGAGHYRHRACGDRRGLRLDWISIYSVRIEALICITIILAVSLNLINGLTGLFSIGHAGFMLIGAYAAGVMTAFVFGPHARHPVRAVLLCLSGRAADRRRRGGAVRVHRRAADAAAAWRLSGHCDAGVRGNRRRRPAIHHVPARSGGVSYEVGGHRH